MTTNTTTKPKSRKPRRMTREPGSPVPGTPKPAMVRTPGSTEPGKAEAASKASTVLAMLQRAEGATIEQMIEATGWQPHTTRAVLTGFRKKGHTVTSDKVDGVRTYRIASNASEEVQPSEAAQAKVDA